MDQEEGNGEKSEHMKTVPADLWNFGKGELLDGEVTIEISASTYVDKGEDRHVVSFGNKEMAACQQDFDETVPRMVAYVAVFDGHDGANASEYAHRGLLPHILSETEDCHRKNHKKKGGVAMDPLGEAITNAFHKAQERFAMKLDPPTIQDVKEGVKATRYDNKGHIARHMLKTKKKPRGGTTALTLQIYGECGQGSKDGTLLLVVANTGDCRLLTDDGLGSHEFRQVTTDHRPLDDDEHDRLKACVREGNALLGRELGVGTLRVYPGGLAVSRSIGDLDASGAIICSPDIYRIPMSGDDRRKHRLVLASDGLWDVFTNSEVGKIVSRIQKKPRNEANANKDENEKEEDAPDANEEMDDATNEEEVMVNPNQAAAKLMEECLRNGGHMDDVTIIIVDICYTGGTAK